MDKDIVETLSTADLPAGWRLDTLPDLIGKHGLFLDGDWIESKDQDPNGDVRLIQLADIGDSEYRNRSDRYLTYEKAVKLGCTFLQKGDVLIARMPDPLGRACIFPGDSKKAVTAVDVCIVRPNRADVNNRWLMYFVNAPAFRAAVASLQSGSTRKRISRSNLAKIQLPVPPDDQQKLIVAEIEKQFSRLDEAVAGLKRVKANLKRYKAAVLKAAVEGESLGWPEYRLADICQVISGFAFKSSSFRDSGIPVIKIANVGYGEFHWKDQEYLPPSFLKDHETFIVHPGDILLALTRPITNGTVKVCRYPADARIALLNQRVAVLRPTENLKEVFLMVLMQSEIFKKQIEESLSETLQPNLSPVDLKNFTIRIPDIQGQINIGNEVERQISIVVDQEVQIDLSFVRAERLRRSVLASAFEGLLVPRRS